MKIHHIISVLLCCVLSLVSSCEKAPLLVLSGSNALFFPEEGGTQKVSFSSNRPGTASSSEPWCKAAVVPKLNSEGGGTVTITCAPNTTYDSRIATVTIKAGELMEVITVTQDKNLELLVDNQEFNVDFHAQVIRIDVQASVDYSIEIEESARSWLSVSETRALSSNNLELDVAANEAFYDRIGQITLRQVNGSLCQTIVVRQNNAYISPEPHFREGVELICLVFRLMGQTEFQYSIPIVSESVDAFFASMKDHEALKIAKESRVGYDAVTAFGLHLLISENGVISFNPVFLENTDTSLGRWPESLKGKMLTALNDFYEKSNFHEWYESVEPLRRQVIQSFKRHNEIDYGWFDTFYGPSENLTTQIVLSFLIGKHNHGLSVDLPDGGKLLSPVMGSIQQDKNGNPYYSSGILGTLIHEFSHPYCNPLIDKYWDSMAEKAELVYNQVDAQMISMAYGRPQTMICETLVRACTIRYLLTHGYDNKEQLILNEESKGFLLMRCLVDVLEEREQHPTLYPTLDAFMPEVVKAINAYSIP